MLAGTIAHRGQMYGPPQDAARHGQVPAQRGLGTFNPAVARSIAPLFSSWFVVAPPQLALGAGISPSVAEALNLPT